MEAHSLRPALALALTLLLAPLAVAQDHEHGGDKGAAMVLYDGPVDGRAVVGAYTHLGFALLDKDGAPVVHQNAEFLVEQNGAVLFSTTDTHEYDGLFSLDLQFLRTGPYRVTATSDEMVVGVFEGEVVAPVDETVASVQLTATPSGPASRVLDVVVDITGPDGQTLPHTDAIVEFREAGSGALYSRAHLHIHDAPIAFTQGFGAATDYVAHVVAYKAFNTGRTTDVRAIVGEFPVTAGALAPPGVPMPEVAPPGILEQIGAKASADGFTLHATYDPSSQVGIGQAARIAGLVVDDANKTPLAHVDFALTLSGPRGLVFSSESLHEYDGMLEYLFYPETPGSYDGTLFARYGDTELSVPVHLVVLPPVVPLGGGAGVATLAVDGLDGLVANEPAELTFSAMGPMGPAAHSEVDVTLFHHGEAPIYQFKLHTHGSGLTSATVQFPHAGDWLVRIDALPTVPEPIVYPPTLVEFTVAPGAPLSETAALVDGDVRANVPGAWVGLLVLGFVVAALARRR